MVKDLEKLAKYESDNLAINKTEFDLGEVINIIVRNFETEFALKNVKLKFLYRSEKIYGDRDKISQVIINLISNGLKYTDEGGVVEINVDELDTYIVIKIKDNGIGMSEEDLPHIFERFYRADKSRNRLTGGAGIGLTITKAIIDAHKGKIKVDSIKGKGTEFEVLIPKK